MQVVPSYTNKGISFNLLEPGEPFWWVDQVLIKLELVLEEGINAVSLHNGSLFALSDDRIVRRANVQVTEKDRSSSG